MTEGRNTPVNLRMARAKREGDSRHSSPRDVIEDILTNEPEILGDKGAKMVLLLSVPLDDDPDGNSRFIARFSGVTRQDVVEMLQTQTFIEMKDALGI